MTLTTVLAVSYDTMAAFLLGSAGKCASASDAHDRTWIISVTNSDANPTNAFEGWRRGVPDALVVDAEDRLALRFDDAEPRGDNPDQLTYFDREMARRICDFIQRVIDAPGRNLLLVNCHAGVSRSGAIADVARTMGGVDFDLFCRANPQVVPNRHVRELLLKAWQEKERP